MLHKLMPSVFIAIALLQNCFAEEPEFDFMPLRKAAMEELKQNNIPGVAIAIIRGDRVIFSEAIGVANLGTHQPVTPEMLFQIGSTTKTLTATVAVQIAEEGKLDFNSPIEKYVSGLNPKIGAITMHQLLNQTSGLKDVPGEWGSQDELGLGKYLRSLNEESVLIKPGKAFSYSNLNFALAGFVVEEIEKKPYAEVMRNRLFKPLGMKTSTFLPTEAMTYPIAMGHRISEAGVTQIVRPIANDTRLWPAGYAYCSLNDFTRFAMVLLNRGVLDGKQIIPTAAIDKMMKPSANIPTNVFQNGHYGYGLFIHEQHGRKIVEHGGTMPGFMAEMILVPDKKIAIVCLANNDSERLSNTTQTALQIVDPANTSKPVSNSSKPIEISEAEAKGYVGKYSNRWDMDIFYKDATLYLRRFGTELPISKIGTNRFRITPKGASNSQEFLLVPDDDGNIEYMQMFLWVFKKN